MCYSFNNFAAIMVDGISPVAFKQVAGASINQAIVESKRYASAGKPKMDRINNSLINPPEGIPDIAIQINVASSKVIRMFGSVKKFRPNIANKNIIFNTVPMLDPSICVAAPRDKLTPLISSLIFSFLVVSMFTGRVAMDEQVAREVNADGPIFFHKALTPFFPFAKKAYKL